MRKSLLIAVALLFWALQSCTVYHKTWVSMDEAMTMGKQKVKLAEPNSFRYREFEMHADTLFGSQLAMDIATGNKNANKSRYASPIPEPFRSYQVHLLDKKKSRKATFIVSLIIISLPVVVGIGLYNSLSFNIGF